MKKNKKLLWFLTSRGFGSEINNLLYAINYSEKNDYELVLDTTFWNSTYKEGWNDYFIPFQTNCKKTLKYKILIRLLKIIDRFQKVSSVRSMKRSSFLRLLVAIFKNEIITIYEYFVKVRKYNNNERLKNKDEFLLSMNKILKRIWRFDPKVLSDIKNKKTSIDYDYAAFHIRRGDKIESGEDNYYSVEDYMNKLKSINSTIKIIFVMSDDFSVYKELKNKFLDYKFISIIPDSKRGYNNYSFNRMKKSEKKFEVINLIAEIEIARESKIFIGSYRSNLYRLIEYLKLENCYNIGFKDEHDNNMYI